ncbi:hypothetical protein BN988_01942 [Oceanobacillus picturae]|uniref:Glycine zipper-like domain-containing protein n=1 Tax=Oceanobacillus picturae TaxID=171693 RepID=W9AD46_9BACI|nr:hypothetical protein [Oceanobacillus picturae]CDO03428.1 hypothetical protein BN988_01942 [Oceanobacillus picturae]
MESQRVKNVVNSIEEISNNVDEQVATELELEKFNRIINRLDSFSNECEECEQYFTDLESHIKDLLEKNSTITEDDIKHHNQKINNISTHLMKKHNLVTSGFYFSVYMPIGTSLGVVFGLLIFDNIGIGLPLGVGLGVAIGAALDANAKKKGLVL